MLRSVHFHVATFVFDQRSIGYNQASEHKHVTAPLNVEKIERKHMGFLQILKVKTHFKYQQNIIGDKIVLF